MKNVIEAYAARAPSLIERFNSISSRDLFAPVSDLLPAVGTRVADIGAGTGRDAAWLARMGHTVIAVEPVREFREAGMATYDSSMIEWIDDRLPELVEMRKRGKFDLVVLSAVWQHLDASQRAVAMTNLAKLTAPDGLLIMSLRHGDGAPDRAVYPVDPDDTIAEASRVALRLVRRVSAPSVQQINSVNGVTWTWLAFKA